MARDSMAGLISKVRTLAGAGTADYTLAGATYWTDDQVEDVLDAQRVDWREIALLARPEYSSTGDQEYHDYYIPAQLGAHWEGAGSASIWTVREAGVAVGTALYTADLNNRRIRFTADQAGAAYTLDASSYNVHQAASDIWRRKAAYYAESVDWQTDGHRVSASQLAQQCREMADYYADQSGVQSVPLVRNDVRFRPWR